MKCARGLALLGLSGLAVAAPRTTGAPGFQDDTEDEEQLGYPEPGVQLASDWRVNGIFSVHALDYDSRNSRDDQVEIDRATLQFTMQNDEGYAFRISPDLVGRDTAYGLEEAFLEIDRESPWRLRIGLQRLPLGPESSVREEHLPFIGYSFPAYIDGRTDVAARLTRSLFDERFDIDLSFGIGEGFDPAGERLEDLELRARIGGRPLRGKSTELFGHEFAGDGLFWSAGLALSFEPSAELDILHPLRTKLFDTGNLDADRGRKLHFGLGYEGERWSFVHEFVIAGLEGLELPGGGSADLENQITAFTTTFVYRLTPWLGAPRERVFQDDSLFDENPVHVTPATLEFALRYSNADIDRRLFSLGLTDDTRSSQEFRALSAALNWHPEEDLRVTLEVVRTQADDDIRALGYGGRDTSLVLAFQWTL